MMGSGKSTVGKLVADHLGVPFYDTDSMVEERAGVSIAELWARVGEAGFRLMESEALRAVGPEPMIAAAGGGAVLDPENRALISRSMAVVWLRSDVATLVGRISDNESRPLLGDSPETVLTTLLARRAPIYAGLATHEMDTSTKTVDDVVSEVLGIWQS